MARLLRAAAVWALLGAVCSPVAAQQPDTQGADALVAIARDHQRAGRIEEAAATFGAALAQLEFPEGPRLVTLLHEYGWVEFQRSGQDAADRLWARGEDVAARIGDAVGLLRVSLSRVLAAGPGPARLERIERGLAGARRLGQAELEAGFLQRLGEQQMWDGQYLQAARTLRQAEARYREAGRPDQAARALGPLGRLYRKHGRADLAMAVHLRAFELLGTHGTLEDRAWALAGVAGAEAGLGRFDAARARLTEALTLVQRQRRASDQIETQKAFLELQVGRPADAERITRRIITQGDPFVARLAWHPHAEALYALGRHAGALDAIDRAIEASIEPSELPRLQLVRARVLRALDRRDDALAAAATAIAAVERVRSDLIALDGLKQGYDLFVEALFDFAVGLQVELGHTRDALESAERGRSRAFLDLLRSRRDAAALGDIERSMPIDAEDVPSVANTPAGTADDYAALAMALRSTVLVYWVGPERSFVWAVNQEGQIAVRSLPAGGNEIARLLARAVPALRPKNTGPTRGGAQAPLPQAGVLAGATTPTAWRQLHDALIRPLTGSLPSTPGARLTIVPHGPVTSVPFAALLDERQQYLVERFEIHYLPSARAWASPVTSADQTASGPVVVVGAPERFPAVNGTRLPPLPGARAEARQVAARFPSDAVTIAVGHEAREGKIRHALGEAAVLHFATHAVVSDETPLDGFLALEPGEGGATDDGRLTVREIYGLDVRAGLVVLSACRTASGRPAADGVAGFARAFFSAGVRRVVGGLWDVPDLTSAIVMDAFYSGEDRGTAAALRRAQLGVLRLARTGRLAVTVEGRKGNRA